MRTNLAIAIVSLIGVRGAAVDDKAESRKPTGCEIGAEVPPFYVREITGDHPNLAVCLVCKNGDRPSVLISIRKTDAQVERLLAAMDRTVDAHRADGLRGFAIFLPADANHLKELPARLTTLARERHLSLPLTIPVESTTGPAALKLPDDVPTTVLFYVDKKIVARSFLKAGELTDDRTSQLIELAKSFANAAAVEATNPPKSAK
jgi:hypothetical protein